MNQLPTNKSKTMHLWMGHKIQIEYNKKLLSELIF